jgi:hypothetical protein
MVDLGPATEHDMVLAFLRAEVDSSRFGGFYRASLDKLRNFGLGPEVLLDSPDLGSTLQNAFRKHILAGVRGYGVNQLLFRGFPADVTWRRITLKPTDFDILKYAKWPAWVKLSGGTRSVLDGARNVHTIDLGDGMNNLILDVASDVRAGKKYPELICVDGSKDDLILIEGHTRATAYALAQLPDEAECIVGSSPKMSEWAVY